MARGVSQTGLLDLPNELLELIIDPIVLDDWNTRLLFEKQWFLNLRYVCSESHLTILPALEATLLLMSLVLGRVI